MQKVHGCARLLVVSLHQLHQRQQKGRLYHPDVHRFHTFHGEVQTDGISISVLMFWPQHARPAPALAQGLPTFNGRKRKQQQQQTNGDWVRDLTDRNIDQTHRPGPWAKVTLHCRHPQPVSSRQLVGSAHPREHSWQQVHHHVLKQQQVARS